MVDHFYYFLVRTVDALKAGERSFVDVFLWMDVCFIDVQFKPGSNRHVFGDSGEIV